MTAGGRAGLVALGLAACGGDRPRPVDPAPVATEPDATDDTELEPDPAGRDEAPLEERIAAIERGMNELAPVASQCWAAGAADDFRLAGDVRLLVAIAATAKATTHAEVVADSTGDDVLTRCLVTVAQAYGWAPPLRGQQIELPFHFTAPAMQNVVDRRFVPRKAQAGITVGVLLDQLNTGNPAASLLEVAFAPRAVSGPRELERTELWTFAGPATVTAVGGAPRAVVAGEVMLALPGTRLTVAAGADAVDVMIALVPGGREGAARGGALPGPHASTAVRARPVQPVFVTAAKGKRYPRTGGATVMVIEPPLAKGVVSMSTLSIDAGAKVPAHVHARETEVLYVRGGSGTMTIGGVAVPVTADSVIQIPAGVEHAFTATSETHAVQLYTPAGPEQRFKTMK